VHDADQVDADDPVPLLERCVDEVAGDPDPGVVDEQVDGADLVGEGAHLLAVGDVHAARQRGARLALGLGEPRLVDVADDQVGAAAGALQRGRAADAAPGAGDEHAAAAQVLGVHTYRL